MALLTCNCHITENSSSNDIQVTLVKGKIHTYHVWPIFEKPDLFMVATEGNVSVLHCHIVFQY